MMRGKRRIENKENGPIYALEFRMHWSCYDDGQQHNKESVFLVPHLGMHQWVPSISLPKEVCFTRCVVYIWSATLDSLGNFKLMGNFLLMG